MGFDGALRGALTALAAVACATALGCGDDSDGAAETTGLDSEPARLVSNIVKTAAAAKDAKDCKEVAAINRRSNVKIVCPPLTEEMRKTNRGIKPVRAATYGPAAVVDYVSPGAKDGASIILYRNPRGEWTIGRWGLSYGQTAGTEDDSRDESRAAVDRYLEAVRERDCESYNKYAATQSAELKDVCEKEFPVTRDLAKVLKSSPDIAYIGGNEDLAFYRVSNSSGARYTVSAVATPKGSLRSHIVLDATPAPKR